MRIPILFLVGTLCFSSVSAQQKKYYYRYGAMVSDEKSARSYVLFEKKGSGYSAIEYSMKGEVMMTGGYSKIDSSLEKGREGAFVYYYTPDHKKREGFYGDNKKQGLWKTYNYNNWSLSGEETFVDDSLDGPYKWYYSADPSTKVKYYEGQFVKGKRVGKWKFVNRDGSFDEYTYIQDSIVNQQFFGPDGKLIRQTSSDRDTLTTAKQRVVQEAAISSVTAEKDSTGQPIVFAYVEQMPVATFDMQQYLKANLVYPAAARDAGIGGRVIVRFTVDAEGTVMDPRIMRGISPELDAEALRVVSAMPKWKPAKQNGKAVKVLYSLPVEFKP